MQLQATLFHFQFSGFWLEECWGCASETCWKLFMEISALRLLIDCTVVESVPFYVSIVVNDLDVFQTFFTINHSFSHIFALHSNNATNALRYFYISSALRATGLIAHINYLVRALFDNGKRHNCEISLFFPPKNNINNKMFEYEIILVEWKMVAGKILLADDEFGDCSQMGQWFCWNLCVGASSLFAKYFAKICKRDIVFVRFFVCWVFFSVKYPEENETQFRFECAQKGGFSIILRPLREDWIEIDGIGVESKSFFWLSQSYHNSHISYNLSCDGFCIGVLWFRREVRPFLNSWFVWFICWFVCMKIRGKRILYTTHDEYVALFFLGSFRLKAGEHILSWFILLSWCSCRMCVWVWMLYVIESVVH